MCWNFVRFHKIYFQTDSESFTFLSWKTNVLFRKKYFFGRIFKHAKIIPKNGASRLNFPEGFARDYTIFRANNLLPMAMQCIWFNSIFKGTMQDQDKWSKTVGLVVFRTFYLSKWKSPFGFSYSIRKPNASFFYSNCHTMFLFQTQFPNCQDWSQKWRQ